MKGTKKNEKENNKSERTNLIVGTSSKERTSYCSYRL